MASKKLAPEQAREMQKRSAESKRRRFQLLNEIYISEPDIGASMIDSILKGTPIGGVVLDDAVRQRLILDILKEYGPQLLAMRSKHVIDVKQKLMEFELAKTDGHDSDSDSGTTMMTTTDLMAELGTQSEAESYMKYKGPSSDQCLGSDLDSEPKPDESKDHSFGAWFDTLSTSAQRKVTSKFEDADEMFNHWSADATTIRARYGLMGAGHGG